MILMVKKYSTMTACKAYYIGTSVSVQRQRTIRKTKGERNFPRKMQFKIKGSVQCPDGYTHGYHSIFALIASRNPSLPDHRPFRTRLALAALCNPSNGLTFHRSQIPEIAYLNRNDQ